MGVKGIRQRAVKSSVYHKSGSKRPETKQNFQFYQPNWLKEIQMEHLKDNVARTKLFLWKKAQTPERWLLHVNKLKVIQYRTHTCDNYGSQEAPTTPRATNTTARKTMTTDVLEMDTSKHYLLE